MVADVAELLRAAMPADDGSLTHSEHFAGSRADDFDLAIVKSDQHAADQECA